MSRAYSFINDKAQGDNTIKSRLGASNKFDTLNIHIRNRVVMPGEIIIVPDSSTSLGASVAFWVCVTVVGFPSGGLGALGCGIVGGALGGYLGGSGGEIAGEALGEWLYKWSPF